MGWQHAGRSLISSCSPILQVIQRQLQRSLRIASELTPLPVPSHRVNSKGGLFSNEPFQAAFCRWLGKCLGFHFFKKFLVYSWLGDMPFMRESWYGSQQLASPTACCENHCWTGSSDVVCTYLSTTQDWGRVTIPGDIHEPRRCGTEGCEHGGMDWGWAWESWRLFPTWEILWSCEKGGNLRKDV